MQNSAIGIELVCCPLQAARNYARIIAFIIIIACVSAFCIWFLPWGLASVPGFHTMTMALPVSRGVIYDSRMEELASVATIPTVIAEPRNIRSIPDAARSLSPLLGIEPQVLQKRMSDPAHRKYLVLKRRIAPDLAPRIQALHIQGISLEHESVRQYPKGDLASHLLGFVDAAGDGMAGLEMKYDLELNGKPGAVRKLGFRRWSLHEKILTPPVQGRSLVLSIDSGLQNLTQRELVSEIRRSKALAGTAIVMESETGRILALANFPDFNCSTYGQFGHARWKNSAVQDQFEPGAPVKAILAAACLEEKLTKPGEIIDCQMGSITVGRHVYHDARPHGRLTFEQIFEQSSIVGAIKLGMRLGPERLHRSLLSFGFGSRTKIDLPTEIEGSIHDPRRWSGLSLASISFGQEIAATPIQTITAINAIANGGYRVRPSVVDRVVDNSGATVRMNKPERIRLMHSETAASMRNALEGVVLRGAGKRASLEGYRTAGINSNAQKVVAGYYSKTKYVASFVGFAPLPAPRVTVLVQIDEPEEALCGGDVAARVFQKIAQPALYNLPQSSK